MFPGAWCGQMGVAGWMLIGLFWVTYLGLVLWALSRLFEGPRGDNGVRADDALHQPLARGQIDPSEYGTLREELSSSAASNPQPSQLRPDSSHQPGGGGRTRTR